MGFLCESCLIFLLIRFWLGSIIPGSLLRGILDSTLGGGIDHLVDHLVDIRSHFSVSDVLLCISILGVVGYLIHNLLRVRLLVIESSSGGADWSLKDMDFLGFRGYNWFGGGLIFYLSNCLILIRLFIIECSSCCSNRCLKDRHFLSFWRNTSLCGRFAFCLCNCLRFSFLIIECGPSCSNWRLQNRYLLCLSWYNWIIFCLNNSLLLVLFLIIECGSKWTDRCLKNGYFLGLW